MPPGRILAARCAGQVRHLPGYGEYAQMTEGTRTIPVLELRRR